MIPLNHRRQQSSLIVKKKNKTKHFMYNNIKVFAENIKKKKD